MGEKSGGKLPVVLRQVTGTPQEYEIKEQVMTLSLKVPERDKFVLRIGVFGVGGGGCNAINNMIAKELTGVEFIVANTDAQALAVSKAKTRIRIGADLTQGLGAGSDPEIGLKAAQESEGEITEALDGMHMCFVTAGMGGGTGTGAAPYVAKLARDKGILTVGVVTKPFTFEGERRMDTAQRGVHALQDAVNTLIVVPNQNLFMIANEKTTTREAFLRADDILYQGVKSITDLMVRPGMINLDFADVRSIMLEHGMAMMGVGEAEGDDRGLDAAKAAKSNKLLEEQDISDARGVLLNIMGGEDLTLFDLDSASGEIKKSVHPNCNLIIGSSTDEDLAGKVRVSLIATGLPSSRTMQERPIAVETRDVFAPEVWPVGEETYPMAMDGSEDLPIENGDNPYEPEPLQASPAEPSLDMMIAPQAASEPPLTSVADESAGESNLAPDTGPSESRGSLRSLFGWSDRRAASASGAVPMQQPEHSQEIQERMLQEKERRTPAYLRRMAN